MAQSVELAAKTPFDLQGVANGARQLLAYGFASDDVIGTLRRLGDVAAGLGLPLERLTYLYGTTAVQGRLYARDMLQFTSSGIPMLQEMAKMYGKTTEEINAMVSAGKIGFADVKKVIDNMTSEGGKFHNLMEEQSKTINGQISNLADGIDMMFNKIGRSNEGVINTALSSAAYMVEHYQEILDILTVLVATYGTYKTALMLVAAWQAAAVPASSIVAFFELAKGITSAKDAMLLLNMATKANPLGLFLSVITGIITALALFKKHNNEANRIIGEQEQAIISEGREVNTLVIKLTNANTKENERKEALNKLKTIQPSIVEGIDNESSATKRLTDNLVTYNQEQIKRIVLAQKQDALTEAGKRHEEAGVAYINREIEAQKQLEAILARVQSGNYENRLANNTTESPREGDIKKRTEDITRILNDSTKTIRQKLGEVSASLFDTTIIRSIGGQGNALRKSKDELTELGRGVVDAELQLDSAMQDVSDTAKRLNIEISNSVTLSTSNTTRAISASIKKEIDAAKSDISKFKQELKDLQEGIVPVDAKEGFNFTAAIKEKKEAISDKEIALNTLLGIDPKAGSKALKSQNEIDDALLKNLLSAQKERIDAMQDGKTKEFEQIKADKVAKLAVIDQEEREMREKYAKAGQVVPQEQTDTFTVRRKVVTESVVSQNAEVEKKYAKGVEDLYTQIGSVWLTEEEKKRAAFKKTYDGLREQLKSLYQGGGMSGGDYLSKLWDIDMAEDQAGTKNLLDQYKSYTQQREEIEKKFNDDIAEMQAKNVGGEYDANITKAKEQQKEALSGINTEKLKKELNFDAVFGNLDKVSTQTLTNVRDSLKEYMDTAKESLSPTDLKTLADAYEQLNQKISDRTPGEVLKTAFEAYTTANKELKKAQKDKEAAKGTDKEAEAQQRVTDALNKRRAAQIALNESMHGYAAKAGEALGAATAFTGMLEDFGVKIPESIKGALDGIGQVVEGLASIDVTKPFSIVTGVFKMIGGIGKAIFSLFTGDRRKEKEIQRIQEQVDALQKSYDALNDSIEKAYSTDAKGIIEDQNKMLEQQNVLIQKQIEKERSKKDTDKDKINEWQAQIEENNKLIAGNKEKAIDAIFGADVKAAIEDLTEGLVNAWAKSEDKAKSAKDTVRQMMRQMVTESIKAAIQSSGAMENIRKKLEEFYADNVLSSWEQDYIYNMAEDLQEELDRRYGWADSLMKDEDEESREASKRGIATASQESVDQNNGLLTAIVGHTYSLCEGMKLLQPDVSHIKSMMGSLMDNAARQLMAMQGIEINTRSLSRLEKIEADMGVVKSTLSDINLKGIKIR